MRKLIIGAGVLLIASSLVALMMLDRELNLVLFGAQTAASPPQIRSSPTQYMQLTQSVQTTLYVRMGAYLLAILGLILIPLGILLEPKGKPCKEEGKVGGVKGEEPRISNASLIYQPSSAQTQDLKAEKKAIIRLESVTKIYSGNGVETHALRGVSLKIYEGEFVAIVGPSGSGKSTLLHIIGGLDRPTTGKVYIDGIDISTMSGKALAELRNRKIGFVFQSFNLISRMSALDNVAFPLGARGVPPKTRREAALTALKLVGMGEMVDRAPTRLSGGEQQRTAVARALVTEAPILLCDEPTGNLDTQNTKIITELLYRLNKEYGKTVVVITHNMEVAKAADRLLFLRDGKVEREERLRGV